MFTLRLLLLLDFVGFCSVVLLSQFLAKGSNRVELLGWISVAFATSVFAAPLSIIVRILSTYYMYIDLHTFFMALLLFN